MQGLFGIHSKEDCLKELFLGTFGLQHRGQVYCGLATTDGEDIKIRTHRGLVAPTFDNDLAGLEGIAGIGVTSSVDRQPMSFFSRLGKFVVGIDGYIVNSHELLEQLYFNDHVFSTEQDAELLATLIGEKLNLGEGIRYALDRVAGPCALLLLCPEGVYGARDLHGMKPLMIGKKKGAWAFSSGSCAFNNGCGFKPFRDVKPGEIVFLGEDGPVTVSKQRKPHRLKRCSFEWIYFAEPDSVIEKIPVARVRHNLGANLAANDEAEGFGFTAEDTVVGPVPNSGIIHAEGYHLKSGLPSVELFKPPKYILRTYNLPLEERKRQKSRKLAPIKENIQGKRVVLADDSIRSAITITGIIKMLFDCEASEVHVRIACPNSIRYCPFDNPPLEEEEFIAATKSAEEIRQIIGATSLRFQNLADVPAAIGLPEKELCLDCFLSGQS